VISAVLLNLKIWITQSTYELEPPDWCDAKIKQMHFKITKNANYAKKFVYIVKYKIFNFY